MGGGPPTTPPAVPMYDLAWVCLCEGFGYSGRSTERRPEAALALRVVKIAQNAFWANPTTTLGYTDQSLL